LLGGGGSVSSTTGVAGAIVATVGAVAGAAVGAVADTLSVTRGAGGVEVAETGTLSAATTVSVTTTVSALATATSFAVAAGNVIVPTGDGKRLTSVTLASVVVGVGASPGADDPSGARALWVAVKPACGATGAVEGGSVAAWAVDSARSAAPKAAVIPRIAVAERPVERIRADRATWRSRVVRGAGCSVVVIVVLVFMVFALFVFVVLAAIVVMVVVVVVRWARRVQVATGG
jgi:hypothetical protein